VDFPPNPNDFDLNTNRQVVQAHIAVATNNFIGRGPGNSRVRDFLYHAESDFIFAIILEELGVFGGFIVMFLYVIILFRAAQIARRCDSYMSTYMVLGLALLIGLQALINMSVAVDIIPVTGQTLPMVSKGGSSILAMCLYFGIMINISRNAQKKPVLSSAEA
jgi:cell division protein FtsW